MMLTYIVAYLMKPELMILFSLIIIVHFIQTKLKSCKVLCAFSPKLLSSVCYNSHSLWETSIDIKL